MTRRAALAMMLLASACDPRPRTEILLSVSADETVRAELASVRIRVLGGTDPASRSQSFDRTLPSSEIRWPIELGIVPLEGDAARTFEVEVSALDASDGTLVLSRVATGFVQGETRVLSVHLAASCRAVSCSETESCEDGGCAAVRMIDPSTLPLLDESSVCEPGALEICGNDVDEDCSGEIDNGCPCSSGATRACGTDVGECTAGVQTCTDAAWGTCAGSIEPAQEICNGLDDDCDGANDGTAADPACAGGANVASGTCNAGACVVTCNGTFADCTSDPGCETDTMTSAQHCGACNNSCGDGACVSGTCRYGLAAGNLFTCLRRAGGVWCWGDNSNGELGNGTTTDSALPVQVSGLSDAVEIAVGGVHACARQSTGGVVCWGDNGSGELGNGTAVDSSTPTPVVTLSDAVEIAVHSSSTSSVGGESCARRATGEVACWGSDSYGQLGDGGGAGVDRPTPVMVSGITDASLVSVANAVACARRSSGVDCWGRGSYVGDGTSVERDVPTMVVGLPSAVAAIDGGGAYLGASWAYFTCATLSDRTVWCWGSGSHGNLGNGSTAGSTIPTRVLDLTDATQISAGGAHACARRATGEVACWGYNGTGQLGDGTTSQHSRPVAVVGITNAIEVAAGANHSCALLATGEVMCWGALAERGTSDTTLTPTSPPNAVMGLP